METYKSFVRNNVSVVVGQILVQSQKIIIIPIIIKTVGTSVYGGYVLISSILGFIFAISSFGVGFKRNRYLPSTQDRIIAQKLVYAPLVFQFITLLLLSSLLIVCFPYVQRFFFKTEANFSIWLVVPYFISYLFYSTATDYFRYSRRVNLFSVGTASFPYVAMAIVLICYAIANSFDLNTLVVSQIAAATMISVPLIFLMTREIGVKLAKLDARNLIGDIRLGFPLIILYAVDIMLNSNDRFMISYFISVTAVAYYFPAFALGSLIIFFAKISGVVLPPLLARSLDSGRSREPMVMFSYTVRMFLLLSIPYVVGSAILSKPLLELFANREVAENAYLVTPIVALSSLFYGLNLIVSNVLFVELKTATIFRMNILAVSISVLLNVFLLYIFRNIVVSAISALISYFMAFLYSRRVTGGKWPFNACFSLSLKSVVASLVMGVVLYLLSGSSVSGLNSITRLSLQIVCGGLIYFIGIIVLGVFSRKELIFMLDVVSKTRSTL